MESKRKVKRCKVVNPTERICQALREVKMMKEGKMKETSMEEFLNELYRDN